MLARLNVRISAKNVIHHLLSVNCLVTTLRPKCKIVNYVWTNLCVAKRKLDVTIRIYEQDKKKHINLFIKSQTSK